MNEPENKVVTAQAEIDAPFAEVFEHIADPSKQPLWDGNDNLAEAHEGQRVHHVGDVFRTMLTKREMRENEVVEFTEGRLIAWKPSPVGEPQPGQVWRWELEPQGPQRTLVRHTYDWTALTDEKRMERARNTREQNLMASILKLKELLEGGGAS